MKKTFFLLFFLSCTATKKIQQEDQVNHFPVVREKVTSLPPKDKFYIFLMAGQSNMAGRGWVQPQDTLSSPHVLVLNKNNEWEYAKEPLHFYEPGRTGLDCGLSFGKKLAALHGNTITIGLVPCAIGGSSIEQWLGDSTYREVTLFTNLINRAVIAQQSGTIKGMLWHQGETNATAKGYRAYREKLETFFTRVRDILKQPGLPVYMGGIATFLKPNDNPNASAVNADMETIARTQPNVYLISTTGLTPKPDSIHFDSHSQRIMGERFAVAAYKH